MKSGQRSFVSGALATLAVVFLMGQSIKTDGEVEALGFTGDGSGLDNVTADDSNLLDGMDSSAFAATANTYTKAEVDAALDAALAAASRKKFYLTQEASADGSQATTACNAGFHMGSKWELRALDQLTYAGDEAGAQGSGYDIGTSGQPVMGAAALGWARTGYVSNGDAATGSANCHLWSSTGDLGSGLRLVGEDVPMGAPFIEWEEALVPCSVELAVWCVED